MIKKYYNESIKLESKQYRDVVRQIKKDLEKKFNNIEIESTFYFLDNKNIEYANIVIGMDRNITDYKELIGYVKNKSVKEPINNEKGFSIFYKVDKEDYVQINIFLTDKRDMFSNVRIINSFEILENIFRYYSLVYDLEFKNYKMFKDDKILCNNIGEMLNLFSLNINEFNKNMNFSDFCNKILNSISFVFNEKYIKDIFDDCKTSRIFKEQVLANKDKLEKNKRDYTLSKIEKISNPKDYANKIIKNMENIEIDIIENLLNLYLSENTSVNILMIQTNVIRYLNSLLESFYMKQENNSYIIMINDVKFVVEACYKKISNIKNELTLFRITNTETMEYVLYGFKINLNISFRELSIDPMIFNDINDDIFIKVCELFNVYINTDLKFEFHFETNRHDIEAKIGMNMDKKIKNIKPKELAKLMNLK